MIRVVPNGIDLSAFVKHGHSEAGESAANRRDGRVTHVTDQETRDVRRGRGPASRTSRTLNFESTATISRRDGLGPAIDMPRRSTHSFASAV